MKKELGALEKLNNQIDVDKEVLSVLPKNNKRNLQAYKNKADEIKHEYVNLYDNVILELKRRTIKIKSIEIDPKIEQLENQIKEMDNVKLLDNNITSFEKMELEEVLYTLKRFYKNNLELVNEAIVACLDKFRMAGINLRQEDFDYSIYTNEYMRVFLDDMRKGDINSSRIKDTFEQIYWKCSDIIIHIELNFRSLYFKYEKQINKYFSDISKDNIKRIGLNEKEAIERYNALQSQLLELKNRDTSLIVERFLKNEKNPKDYEESSIEKNYKKLIGKDVNELTPEELVEINKNIYRLQNSLYEYKHYLEFKYIYDDAIEVYKDNEKYKNLYNQKYKQIKKLESKLRKANNRLKKYENHIGILKKIFKRNTNRLEEANIDINSIILQLRDEYRELEEYKTKNIISTVLNDGSTIYDVLILVCQFYNFLVDSIIKQNPDITQENIEESIKKYNSFVKYPRITIINNININEDKNMVLMIKDKYNLCNLNIEKGDLDVDNLPNLITTVNNICDSNYIKNSSISVDEIKFILQSEKILIENNKI